MSRFLMSMLVVSFVLTTLPVSSTAQPEAPPLQAPIVNGQIESGFEGVGALTIHLPSQGYRGSFCTGTLMGQRWVLTAAHCLSPSPEFTPDPSITKFYMGPDARVQVGGELPEGTFIDVDRFYVHPDYDPNTTRNDIAMMHLAEPVMDVQGYGPNTKSLDDSFLGESVFYVGYGVTDGNSMEGGGVKRSTSLRVVSYDNSVYISLEFGTGVCFGDSGGPGFLEVNGNLKIVGVNSTGWGSQTDACGGGSTHTRVDNYIDWVFDVMENQAPDCNKEPDLCDCPQACGESGQCNNDLCRTWPCKDLYDCYMQCGVGDYLCQQNCIVRASDEAKEGLQEMFACFQEECPYVPGEEPDEGCNEEKCGAEIAACLPNETPGLNSCRDVLDCRDACADSDSACLLGCYSDGDEDARTGWDLLWTCADEKCVTEPYFTPDSADCLWDRCATQYAACVDAADCNPAGKDCPENFACTLNPMGRFDCVQSDGLGDGESCDPENLWPECADGFACLTQDDESICARRCFSDGQCEGGTCTGPDANDGSGASTCECPDPDDDGACGSNDCAADDPTIFPGADEVCGDGADNNCDGAIDEGCDDSGGDGGDNDSGSSGGCATNSQPVSPALLMLALMLLLALTTRKRETHRC